MRYLYEKLMYLQFLLLNDFLQLQPGHWNRLPHVSLGQGHSNQVILQIIKTLQRSQHIATYQKSKTTVIEGRASQSIYGY